MSISEPYPEWSDDEIVQISALQHYAYCPRQCALIYVESVWQENVFTLRGSRAHERADLPIERNEHGVRVERALPLWSDRYGLSGRGDVVEFHEGGIVQPVEYKQKGNASGNSDATRANAIQLCAQAICLEEMLGITIGDGAVYATETRRRKVVAFDVPLRERTLETIEAVRKVKLAEYGTRLPPPVNDARCPRCSLKDACVPETIVQARANRLARNLYVPMEVEE